MSDTFDRPHGARGGPHRRLYVAATALAVVETAVLVLAGPSVNQAFGPQVSAPEPLGVFHDLRWLLAYHPSWGIFAAELVALVAFRTGVSAFMVREAWPQGVSPPSWRVALQAGALYTVTTLLLLAPWAGLLFGMGLVSLSWLFFAGVPGAFAVAFLVHHGVITGRWWRRRPSGRTLAWVGASIVVLSVAGLVIVELPDPAAPLVAGAAGLFNARAWRGIVAGALDVRVRRRVPFVPMALAGFVGIAMLGTALGVRLGTPGPASAIAAARRGGAPVIVVKGFGSRWNGASQTDFTAASTPAASRTAGWSTERPRLTTPSTPSSHSTGSWGGSIRRSGHSPPRPAPR